MDRSRAVAATLASLVLLAGCSSLLPGGADGEGELVWQTAVPTDRPVTTGAAAPVPDEGQALYRGPENLTDRHHRALTNGSYRVSVTLAVYRNGTMVGRQRALLDRAGNRLHYRTTVEGDPLIPVWRKRRTSEDGAWADRYAIYEDGAAVWNRIEAGNETQINRIYESGLSRFPYADESSLTHASQRARLLTLLRSVPNGSMEAQIVGEDVFTVVMFADELTRQPEFAGGTLVELESLTLVVRSSGLITEARMIYHVRIDGTVYRVIEHVDFETPATVERPAWVPQENATATPGGTETGARIAPSGHADAR